jgi:gluconokinase
MIVLVMGVAGSGKTTVGQRLATELGWSFADADDFHSAANIAKMAAGLPLTDADREPWLAALRRHIDDCLARGENAVVACSALKASYRAALIGSPRDVRVVHLAASPAVIKARLAGRTGHFMPPTLADSQYAALEAPADALTVDAAQPPAGLVGEIRRVFGI